MTDRNSRQGERGRRLEGRIALVTGASRGIGAAVAVRYAREGAHLVLVARTQGGLEETDDAIRQVGGSATLCPLDLRDGDAIDQLAFAVFQRFDRLDVLVGNAGVLGTLSPVGHVDPSTWNEVFAVNVTANWRLIRNFDPLLRRSDAGRAVFTTSGAAAGGFAYWAPYAASKAALETMVSCWAAELGKTRVHANLVDPGKVRTGLRAAAFPGENPEKLPSPEAVTEPFVALAELSCTRNGQIVRTVD